MNIKEIINEEIQSIIENWYHGTPDARELMNSGFINKKTSMEYISDPDGYNNIMNQLKIARSTDENLYFKLLDKVGDYKKNYVYPQPVFLSDSKTVASTYANHKKAFDYQNSIPRTFEINVSCNKTVDINAHGDRFRFINVDKVKQGFVNAGIPEQEFNNVLSRFNFYLQDKKGIKTDMIAAIGNWFGFDCIDVHGVLDSYHGGNVKSTVRMVLDPTKLQIK